MGKKKRRRRKTFKPFHTFYNARSFQIAATILHNRKEEDLLIWPSIVCESFSLELHLKCLNHLRRRLLFTHDTVELFGRLSKKDKLQIEKNYNAILARHPIYDPATDDTPYDIPSVLVRSRKMFETSRYWHEGNLPDRDHRGQAGTAGIGPLSDAIMQLICEIQPDWTEEKMKSFRFEFVDSKRLAK